MRLQTVHRICVAICLLFGGTARAQELEPGVRVSFQNASGSVSVVRPEIALYVAAGDTPDPFLAPGSFQVVWQGFVSTDIRGIYSFQARLTGSLELMVNGHLVLRTSGSGGLSDEGERVRLLKGTNAIVARYTPPLDGDAMLRVYWKPRRSYTQPIPNRAFSHQPDDALRHSQALHEGRALMMEYRCFHCHSSNEIRVPESRMDAPSFLGIGSRLRTDWMVGWITEPSRHRPSARMPAVLTGDISGKAGDIADYLSTLTETNRINTSARPESPGSTARSGEDLFGSLHCVACHSVPGQPRGEPGKVALEQLANKFTRGSLVDFLMMPDRHFRWTRMPDFGLSVAEASSLAMFLDVTVSADERDTPPLDVEGVRRGRHLVQTSGCLNCHTGPEENLFEATPLSGLSDWESGCLSPADLPGVPRFALGERQRAAIKAFADSGFAPLERNVASEFAVRHIQNLNCIECHDHQIDQVPPLELIGQKLNPEYAHRIITGDSLEKPRPWLSARMPRFHSETGSQIAQGLASLAGFPGVSNGSFDRDPDLAAAGRRLVSPVGGFGCTACHAIGQFNSGQLFESPGVNFDSVFERLQYEYFQFWMLNPLQVDPTTKMPVYFDEEKRSPLFEILNGDADRQIEALWHYLGAGSEMVAPEGISPALDGTADSFE